MKNLFEYKEGDIIQNGEYKYKVIKKDGKLGIHMKHWGFITLADFFEEFHYL